jgi:hypothetical protein
MGTGLHFSKKGFFVSIVYIWIFSIQFSHAPSYIHPLISLPGILSLVLIFSFYFYSPKVVSRYLRDKFFYLLIFTIPVSTLFTISVAGDWNDKYLNYLLAHIWFLLLLYVIYAIPKNFTLSIKALNYALILGVSFSCIFSYFEAFAPFFNMDVAAILPRYDRQDYRFFTPFVFFRTRAFNYESANLAMLINVYFVLIYYINRLRIDGAIASRMMFFTIWFVSLLFTFSAFQLLLFFLFICIYVFTSKSKRIVLVLLATIFGLAFMTDYFAEIVTYIQQKAYGDSESSEVRLQLLIQGLHAIESSPIFGYGYGGFYNFQATGYNNFYLQLFIQLGIAAILYYAIFTVLLVRAMLTKNLLLIFSFIFAWGHLFVIGDFWLGQIILPILFVEYHLRKIRLSYG